MANKKKDLTAPTGENTTPTPEESPTPPGIFVYVERTSEAIRVNYRAVGGFDDLAVPTTLELARNLAQKHLGLDP